jgi:hypothetical protein
MIARFNPKSIYQGTRTEFVNGKWETTNVICIDHSFRDVFVEEEGKFLELHTCTDYATIEEAEIARTEMISSDELNMIL